MVKFINRVTGGEMWVHESRVQDYLAMGHMIAPPPPPPPPKKTKAKAK